MTYIFSIWLSLIPLIVWQSHFEVPKVFIFLLGGIVILFYFLINFKKLVINKSDKWYLLWLLTLLVSSFLGEDFKTGILGGSYRHQGFIFFLCLWLVIKFKNLLVLFDTGRCVSLRRNHVLRQALALECVLPCLHATSFCSSW